MRKPSPSRCRLPLPHSSRPRRRAARHRTAPAAAAHRRRPGPDAVRRAVRRRSPRTRPPRRWRQRSPRRRSHRATGSSPSRSSIERRISSISARWTRPSSARSTSRSARRDGGRASAGRRRCSQIAMAHAGAGIAVMTLDPALVASDRRHPADRGRQDHRRDRLQRRDRRAGRRGLQGRRRDHQVGRRADRARGRGACRGLVVVATVSRGRSRSAASSCGRSG